MQKILIRMVRFYQKFLSFDTGVVGRIYPHQPTCRFHPRCSEYTIQAIEKYGAFKGSWLGVKRIGRCHPWNDGGVDEVK
jgi:putative membrane protein insertion efficiency factor